MIQLPDEILYDVRLVERHIRKGLITRKDAEACLKALEDQTEQAEHLSFASLINPTAAGDESGGDDSSGSVS